MKIENRKDVKFTREDIEDILIDWLKLQGLCESEDKSYVSFNVTDLATDPDPPMYGLAGARISIISNR